MQKWFLLSGRLGTGVSRCLPLVLGKREQSGVTPGTGTSHPLPTSWCHLRDGDRRAAWTRRLTTCSRSSGDTQEPANRRRAGVPAVSTTVARPQGSFNAEVSLSRDDLHGETSL